MLPSTTFRTNFHIISIGCQVGILPFRVDKTALTLNLSLSKICKSLSRCLYLLFCTQALYIDLRFIWVISCKLKVPPYFVMWHGTFGLGLSLVLSWYYIAYIRLPHLFIGTFNLIVGPLGRETQARKRWTELFMKFTESSKKKNSSKKCRNRSAGNQWIPKIWRKIQQFSPQECIVMALPYIAVLFPMFAANLYIRTPDITYLLYSSVPEKLKTPILFYVLLPEEVMLIYCAASIMCPILQAHAVFSDKVSHMLQKMPEAVVMSKTISNRFAYRKYFQLRQIQLLVGQFNEVHCYVIFTFKIICLTFCIFHGYSSIAQLEDNLLISTLYYNFFVNMLLIYTVLYEKAFRIPEGINSVKTALMRAVGMSRESKRMKMLLVRQFKSVPTVGIRAGHFHTLERASTPNFIGFVVQNIGTVLVMMRAK